MIHAPHIHIHLDSWFAATMAVGLMLPFAIAGLAGGYILGGFIIQRAGKTVLGTHVRHFFSRIAPAKRFNSSDHDYVRLIIDDIRRREVDGLEQNLRKDH